MGLPIQPPQALIERLPSELCTAAEQAWRTLAEADPERAFHPAETQADHNDLLRSITYSDFLLQQLSTRGAAIRDLFEKGSIKQAWTPGSWSASWQEHARGIDAEETLMRRLRLFRQRAMFHIVWRDLLKWADYHETVASVSELADTCIEGALKWLHEDSCSQWGCPMGRESAKGQTVPQRLVVLGMGKLGANELNVSSDIDLIFTFPAKGETEGGSRRLDNQQFFIRLGQRLVNVLDKQTADGFVFRVDMRLRPYGQSGGLALSFPAMEAYYQDQGREWERYALIKGRIVAGDRKAGARLMETLRPFVYRRYIDFSAFESLREMKAMINRQVRRKGLEDDIKLGSGGIREVEFIAQAFQLIRGGRDLRLQVRELLAVLDALGQDNFLPEDVVDDLRRGYIFLRNSEHALQGIADRQTQKLPSDPENRARVAAIMGFADWKAYLKVLDKHRASVARHFADIIASDEEEEAGGSADEEWQGLWLGELGEQAALAALQAHGFEDPRLALEKIAELRHNRAVETMQPAPLKRLNYFMPELLRALTAVDSPARTLERIFPLVESVLRRTAYLLLLNENPGALQQLVRLCSESPWIAEQLAETPLLLDELLNTESLYSPPKKAEIEDELRQQLLRIPAGDLEEQMECLRHFKKGHVLRVAASELRGTLPLMKVSDYLTWIAEVVLEQVVTIAWRTMVERYGKPSVLAGKDPDPDDSHFAVIGYGKLGGIELGYTSDLDLVFLHDADPDGATDGEKSIDNAVFFTRLGQRIVHILSTQTPSGQLYEADMRLRPSGNSGLLVTSLAAFERYQRENAWTWEHQALARSRWVAGSKRTGQGFERIRTDVLCQARDRGKLREDVVSMRNKMRETLGTKVKPGEPAPVFHLKQDPGGIVDIEFLVQYLILAWANDYPNVTRWSDNIRQLEELGKSGVLDSTLTERLREIFIAMRSTIHRRALQKLNSVVEADAFETERQEVIDQWQHIMVANK
ncbi:MAG: bifunctional [glutamate--ammonia ligase]-adenylyl-L-tyrosine phosphorylase/[glutamate--ammonia-ligase] adenylyltransferase [Alteromonadaceae bacterium]|nr:bifunctional [glutamate--ammonia ligase]-adenylyl-L-tyrosine phosphorylase/[glutamate--ammonia-ligase] adenylyltransferase [Alteromonadaceae bacterium]|tara:strand:+ start:1750 stop:4695 length:2946 start_codon:yes stop_codon:yes gene_type:complete